MTESQCLLDSLSSRPIPKYWDMSLASAIPKALSHLHAKKFKKAAVLCPLSIDPATDEIMVLLTLRSSKLRSHAGEVSFPGGKQDPHETLLGTALRESHEEIGLPPDLVNVLAYANPALSRHGSVVYPVIAQIPFSFTPIPNNHEVDDWFWCPLRWFLRRTRTPPIEGFLETTEEWYHPLDLSWMDRKWEFHSFIHIMDESRKFRIWGLTAYFCVQVAEFVYNRKAEFGLEFPGQPEYIHLVEMALVDPEAENKDRKHSKI
ncbi:NUDIX hydrolase domain-like protein [Paraphysoderma sedebokerense]|nr:NUDIX hydrolase domain-like protein [Paraphysoderma sedebokerense]